VHGLLEAGEAFGVGHFPTFPLSAILLTAAPTFGLEPPAMAM
jgi:hypothetical protein